MTSVPTVRVARHAMATRFEVALHGTDPVGLRAAAEEALDEIERLERRLSLYQPTSEIAHVNARAPFERVRVSPEVFRLLETARQLSADTEGAFDITVAPLVRCWGFMGGTGHLPEPGEISAARSLVGMQLIRLYPEDFTVEFLRPGVMIDLGAIGKGYAVGVAIDILREAGVSSALVHGGTSTVEAIGSPPGADAWTVAIEDPRHDATKPLATVPLRDEALSVSAVWGRSFVAEGRTLGHVIDPRTGQPVNGAVLAAVVLNSATETDALSTALLTLGAPGQERIQALRPGLKSLVATVEGGQCRVTTRGIDLLGEAEFAV